MLGLSESQSLQLFRPDLPFSSMPTATGVANGMELERVDANSSNIVALPSRHTGELPSAVSEGKYVSQCYGSVETTTHIFDRSFITRS